MPNFPAPPILDGEAYIQRLLALPRPGAANFLAFYDHRLRAVCRDPQSMLLPLDDHLVHRGDGVFESLKYVDGKAFQLDAHLERLRRSAKTARIELPLPLSELRALILSVAKAGGEPQGLLRILLGRGPGGFGIDPAECPEPSLYIAAYRFTPWPESVFERGVTATRVSIPAKQGLMARIKSTNYLQNTLMKMEAKDKGVVFPFCFDERGFLAESATENIALVDQAGTLIVPELTNALTGTTLMRAIDLMQREIPVTFREVNEEAIYEAKECLMLGTSFDVAGVVRYNGKPIHDVRPGPVAKRMRALLQEDLRTSGVPIFEG